MRTIEIGNITIIERGRNHSGRPTYEIFTSDGEAHKCSSHNIYRVVLHALELETEGINGNAGQYAARLFSYGDDDDLDNCLWVGG